MVSETGGRLIRVLAFLRKDLFEVLRQPRLLLTLVLGPFLILLAFGAGFAPEPPKLRTVLVVPAESGLEERSADLAERISQRVDLIETTADRQRALDLLATGEADIAVVVPADAANRVREGEHAEIEIYHDQIDPFEQSFIEIFAASSVEDLNNELWHQVVEESQTGSATALSHPLVDDFQNIPPEVLVSPFVTRLANFQGVAVDFNHFYVPGVVALLLQHMALTFAALSLVRERSLGTVELFRVSPLSGGETLVGKYLAYTLLGGLVGAALTAAAYFGFGFQPAGSWWWFALINLLVLLAAQGAGFVVSAVARTESEAVQYAMILLLVAIFFSGFFISLDRLIPSVRVISYLIPATYGILGMQDVAFRGLAPSPFILGGVGGLAAVLLATAWILIRTRVVAAVPAGR
jgi:ABC-2 type transport system permease protein